MPGLSALYSVPMLALLMAGAHAASTTAALPSLAIPTLSLNQALPSTAAPANIAQFAAPAAAAPAGGARQFLLRESAASEEVIRLCNCRGRDGKLFSEVAYYDTIASLNGAAPGAILDSVHGPVDGVGMTRWENNEIRADNARRGFRNFVSRIVGDGPVLNRDAGEGEVNGIPVRCYGDAGQFVYATVEGTACSSVYYCTGFGPFA